MFQYLARVMLLVAVSLLSIDDQSSKQATSIGCCWRRFSVSEKSENEKKGKNEKRENEKKGNRLVT